MGWRCSCGTFWILKTASHSSQKSLSASGDLICTAPSSAISDSIAVTSCPTDSSMYTTSAAITRLCLSAGMTGAMSVSTISVRPTIPATPHPVPSSTARRRRKSRSSAYGFGDDDDESTVDHRSANLERIREQGQTEVPTCIEPLSCWIESRVPFTVRSITGESVNFISMRNSFLKLSLRDSFCFLYYHQIRI
ncbi:unnamed protein product [Thlaspi arvense]|uniref:Uncharacterized protein n=1 Tax=Thlaspi arvense TaxID=13288 RepID=A0AAU9RNU7_THLAR|nr:unnamed protein product [Thlaspi arvense]